jgi:hypothetical protein
MGFATPRPDGGQASREPFHQWHEYRHDDDGDNQHESNDFQYRLLGYVLTGRNEKRSIGRRARDGTPPGRMPVKPR